MRRIIPLALALALLATAAAEAQTIGTPVYRGPYKTFKTSEFAAYLADPGDIAIQGEFRMAQPNFDWGLTLGYIDMPTPLDGFVGVGGDVRAKLARHNESFPLDASATLGFGGQFGNGLSTFFLPFNVTMGRQVLLAESNVSFTPYVSPGLIPAFGDAGDNLLFVLALGVDVSLSRTMDLRVSGSLGDLEGVSVGIAFHR